MAVPIALALPSLFTWLGGAFATVAAWFATYVTQRVALALAAVVVFTTLWATFAAAISTLIGNVQLVIPSWALSATEMLPTQTPAFIATMVAADLSRRAYDYGRNVLAIKVGSGR